MLLNFTKYYKLFIIAVLLTSCKNKPVAETNQSPNIILICVDDMGWSDIGCYGSEIATPNIDSLAYRGMRFTNFYNNAKCYPSRASLLTGVYPQDCGYDKTFTNPITNAVTIGEVLKQKGYLTFWSGKHHGKENPYTRGFDRYFGLKDGASNHFNPGNRREGEPQPAQKRNDRTWIIDNTIYQPYTPKEKDFYTTDYFTNYALKYLEEAKEKEKSFFLYLAYTAPHDPLMAWPEDIKKYKAKYNTGYEKTRKKRYQKQLRLGIIDSTYKLSKPTYSDWEQLSDSTKTDEAKKMEVYAAMIDRVDQNIGRLLNKLKQLTLDKNTLIIFASDNGASAEVVDLKNDNDDAEIGSLDRWESLGKNWANVSNTPFRYYKNYTYEGGINTPCIAYWPGVIKPNSISKATGHFIDFLPTFSEITEAQYPIKNKNITPIRGQSLLSVFKNDSNDRSQPLFWQWKYNEAIKDKQWKMVRKNKSENWELYNLKKDPTETNNVALQYPNIIEELNAKYIHWASRYE